jgi:hypothetical protein
MDQIPANRSLSAHTQATAGNVAREGPKQAKPSQRPAKADLGALPQIVVSDTDLVALVRRHREALGKAQFTIDMDAGLQDGYCSKIEGPGRAYGRRPTKLTRSLSVTFERDSGQAVSVGRIAIEKPRSTHPILTGPGEWWLQALDLALVLMPRQDALAITERAIPTQIPIGPARTGSRVRRLTIDLCVSEIGLEPMPLQPIEPAVLRECARAMARALRRSSSVAISNAMRKAEAAGIDPQALSMAVKMNPETALKLANQMARMAGYLSALDHPQVKVSTLDVVDHVRDEPETNADALKRASAAWKDLMT